MNTYNYQTHSRTILGDLHTPVSTYLKVRDVFPQSALMESSDYHGSENNRSFIGLCPLASVSIDHGTAIFRLPDGTREERPITPEYPVEKALEDFLGRFHVEGEYANYCGNYYGTPRAYVEQQLEAGKDVVLEIEIQGALKIKEKFPTALLLFVMPPSAEELRRRLAGRGTETQEIIDQRMHRAIEEAQGIEQYDYIVINDQLEECVKELHALIGAAHNTPSRNEEFINNMREELKTI